MRTLLFKGIYSDYSLLEVSTRLNAICQYYPKTEMKFEPSVKGITVTLTTDYFPSGKKHRRLIKALKDGGFQLYSDHPKQPDKERTQNE